MIDEKYGKKLSNEQAKKICLDMLVEFDRVCNENNLRYILDYGTLLGCIRHKGFIPWDDDIDVTMPRNDYERLLQLAANDDTLFGEYQLATINNKHNIFKPYANIINKHTISISAERKEAFFYPLWIDIFPMDVFNEKNSLGYYKKISKLVDKSRRFVMKYNSFSKQLFVRFFCNAKKSIKLMKKADAIAKKNTHSSGLLTNYYSSYWHKDVSDISYYDNYIKGLFEGHSFRIPKDYAARLSKYYGDYMTLPPEDKRISHSLDSFYID